MNIKLLNVKYSPNVGDGLLVHCLESELHRSDNAILVSSIDLAGRTGYLDSLVHREKILSILESTPQIFRLGFAYAALKAKLMLGLRKHYRRQLERASAVVVGGGNLFSDQDLNFPLKISHALKEAGRQNLKVAIYGCGVSDTWSRTGYRMICDALSSNPPISVSVRYAASKIAWDNLFSRAAGTKANIAPDPGVLASTIYRFESRKGFSSKPCVAIGVMSSLSIRYHGFSSLSTVQLANWYLTLVDEMVQRGFSIRLFTNGSPEDKVFADLIFQRLSSHRSFDSIELSFVKLPIDLCRVVSDADVVVAFRMHALIAAFSYGKPFVALQWDAKVAAFLDAVDMKKCIFDVSKSSPKKVADFLLLISNSRLDEKVVESSITEARESIEMLSKSLKLI